MNTDDGLTPAHVAGFRTERGPCRIAWTGQGIAWLELPGDGRDAPPPPDDAPAWLRDAMDRIARHLAGDPQDFTGIPLDLDGTGPFARRVYDALRQVPPGAVVTYGELARTVGCPNGARAVGGAMARNPLPLLVPCHRVVGASGGLGGFSAPGGVETKAALLKLEGRA